MALCDPCANEWMRWLDYRVQPTIQLVSIGINSPRAVEQARKLRTDDCRNTIRSQQELIVRHCARNHQEGTTP